MNTLSILLMNTLSILSKDERRKAVLAPDGDDLAVDYFTATYSCAGEIGWKFDRQATVTVQPFAAALDLITKIVNAPPRIGRR